MKLKEFVGIIAMVCCIISCEKNEVNRGHLEWDAVPLSVLIFVENADGQNLLDPNTPNNFVGDTIITEWMGNT